MPVMADEVIRELDRQSAGWKLTHAMVWDALPEYTQVSKATKDDIRKILLSRGVTSAWASVQKYVRRMVDAGIVVEKTIYVPPGKWMNGYCRIAGHQGDVLPSQLPLFGRPPAPAGVTYIVTQHRATGGIVQHEYARRSLADEAVWGILRYPRSTHAENELPQVTVTERRYTEKIIAGFVEGGR